MTDYTIPRANAPIAGQEAPTIQWYNYLRGIGASTADSNAALLADITIISDKLGSPDGTPENIPPLGNITDISGTQSVTVSGANIKQLALVNDVTVALSNQYYGSNGSGTKGWFDFPAPPPQGVPYFIPDTTSYTVPVNIQALWTIPITLDGSAMLIVNGILAEVD